MTDPTIADARRIAKEHELDGVIVLGFDARGHFAGASYGKNKVRCDAYGKAMERLLLVLSTEEMGL